MREMVRGVGFEPTNPYGTGASVRSVTPVTPSESGENRGDGSKALLDMVTGRDIVADIVTGRDWESFQRYVMHEYSRSHALSILRYAKKYGMLLITGDLAPILELSPAKRRHALAALAALAKFTGQYERYRQLRRRYGIKIESETKIAVQLDKGSLEELARWITKARGVLGVFIDFLLATGMRPREAITSFNLIRELARKGRLEGYYNDGFLEHFRFEKIFLRRSKKVYISYCPREIVTAVTEHPEDLTIKKINYRLEKAKLPIKLKEIRKLWASYMTKFLSEPEINLIQGRVSKSVFMQHYFNKDYIPDFQRRIEKGIKSLFTMIASLGVTPVTKSGDRISED